MYILLFVRDNGCPDYFQGTLAEVNALLKEAWINHEIDPDFWDYHNPWQILTVEDGRLTPINNAMIENLPQIGVF